MTERDEGHDFPEVNRGKSSVLAEVGLALLGTEVDASTIARMLEATRVSWGPWRRLNFDCYEAVAYVVGEREVLDGSDDQEMPPIYSEIVQNRRKLSEPNLLSMAIVNTGGEGYHIGLVIDPDRKRIWSKWGQTQADVGPEEYFGSGREVEYYEW